MKVGLVDVDGHNYPNYALMKISAWHKERGDSVEWADPMFGEYDRVYMSKVFTFTEDNKDIWHCEVIKGGTGYDIASKLPEEVDAIQPDYSLYGIEDVSYGFLTRGCVNKCPWCIVPKKEGAVSVYRDIDEVANGRKNVILMDNNILASEYGLEQLDKIAERGRLTRLFVTDAVEVCCANNKHVRCSLGFISSIPITAEILEKNGLFRHEEDTDNPELIVLSNHFILARTYIDVDWWRVLIYDEELASRALFNGIIYSVHQLQHALRLAGVDKEIQL